MKKIREENARFHGYLEVLSKERYELLKLPEILEGRKDEVLEMLSELFPRSYNGESIRIRAGLEKLEKGLLNQANEINLYYANPRQWGEQREKHLVDASISIMAHFLVLEDDYKRLIKCINAREKEKHEAKHKAK